MKMGRHRSGRGEISFACKESEWLASIWGRRILLRVGNLFFSKMPGVSDRTACLLAVHGLITIRDMYLVNCVDQPGLSWIGISKCVKWLGLPLSGMGYQAVPRLEHVTTPAAAIVARLRPRAGIPRY